MSNNVTQLYPWRGKFLGELESELENAEPWTEHKYHILFLVCEYMKRKETSFKDKKRCADIIWRYGDIPAALREVGYTQPTYERKA